MKSLKYLIPVILLLYSCTDVKYGTVDFGDNFEFIYYQDFEHNTTGEYLLSEWQDDWNSPDWVNRDIPPEIIKIDDPENQTKVMRWYFPEGALGPSQGGGQWITELDSSYDELYFSYRVKFREGFKWVLGGKLPGIRGGEAWEGTGTPGWDQGFVALLMWNNISKIKFYFYHHDRVKDYGENKDWDYTIQSGKWYTITIRAVMNTVTELGGNNDGILEGFIDGKMVCQVLNKRFRNLETIGIDRLYVTSFFGGNTEEWASQRDEWIDVDDFVVFYYKSSTNTIRGNVPSPENRFLLLPYS